VTTLYIQLHAYSTDKRPVTVITVRRLEVGWCLTAFSAQKGYIVPCEN